jgi:hypothetical protein
VTTPAGTVLDAPLQSRPSLARTRHGGDSSAGRRGASKPSDVGYSRAKWQIRIPCDTVSSAGRAAHDDGLGALLGGNLFGRVTAITGMRFARSAPDGAVPLEATSGAEPRRLTERRADHALHPAD